MYLSLYHLILYNFRIENPGDEFSSEFWVSASLHSSVTLINLQCFAMPFCMFSPFIYLSLHFPRNFVPNLCRRVIFGLVSVPYLPPCLIKPWSVHLTGFPDHDKTSGSGFGMFAPVTQEDEQQDGYTKEEDEEEEDDGEFISLHELRKNRISREG